MPQGKHIPNYIPHPGSQWITDNRSTLPNNEWVAADKSGLVATDPSLDNLMEKIKAKNINPEDIAISFITHDIWQ